LTSLTDSALGKITSSFSDIYIWNKLETITFKLI